MQKVQTILLPMIAVSLAPSVRQSVCLSRGSTRLRCAKTAKQIKILFEVNIFGGHKKHCVRRRSRSSLQRGKGNSTKPLPKYLTSCFSGERRDGGKTGKFS